MWIQLKPSELYKHEGFKRFFRDVLYYVIMFFFLLVALTDYLKKCY